MKLTLDFYTRPQCNLCDEAYHLLQLFQDDWGFELSVRDISTNDTWTEEYGLRIPVLKYKDLLIDEGQFDLDIIRKRLHDLSSEN
ncbi:glutaredoxin family protein [Mangrovibacillus cuniculi]|uniref:Glutaredoxin family protein n=1 Tax=Mangrovibacillus cuniculi TaxID=2593652 RepID=A0A7S8HFZ8_9BACI|nr:glutaredoxin family protein [Mangrovibacillus cuniculi]